MKVLSFRAVALVVVGLVAGAGIAQALNAPRPLHRPRAEQKLAPHSTASHHAAAKAAPAAHTASKAAPAAHVAAKAGKPVAPALRKRGAATVRVTARSRRHHTTNERFTASSFANGDQTANDVTAGEDPVVRQAAVDALGDMNGTAVVINPANGRILAMVNQKLAL
jgi:membrane carboxypeptidase/penicillin-binding protein